MAEKKKNEEAAPSAAAAAMPNLDRYRPIIGAFLVAFEEAAKLTATQWDDKVATIIRLVLESSLLPVATRVTASADANRKVQALALPNGLLAVLQIIRSILDILASKEGHVRMQAAAPSAGPPAAATTTTKDCRGKDCCDFSCEEPTSDDWLDYAVQSAVGTVSALTSAQSMRRHEARG